MAKHQPPAQDPTPSEPAYRAELHIALEELGRTRAELRWLEQRYFVLVEALEEGIVMLDENGDIVTFNPSARALVGDQAAVERWLWGGDGSDRLAGAHPATETLFDGHPRTAVEMEVAGPDNVPRWLNVNARAVFDMDSRKVAAVLCSFSDISAHKNLEAQLAQQATVDSLTGLFNRRYIERRLEEEIQRAARSGASLSVAMIDIDRFKLINDQYGHPAGDRALQRFAEALLLALRAQDLVARVGGDEFCVVFPGADAPQAEAALGRALDNVRKMRIESDRRSFGITGSAGVVQVTVGADADEALERADAALYRAKEAGRDRVLMA